MFHFFIKEGQIKGCGGCPVVGEGWTNIETTEEAYNQYVETPEAFVFKDGEVVQKDVVKECQEKKELEETKEELIFRLSAIDAAVVRPLRAKIAGTATAEDEQRIINLEADAAEFRAQVMAINDRIAELEEIING